MINTAGAYILILVYSYNGAAMTTLEFPNYDSCKAAITQLEPVRTLRGYCIAKEVQK
jgi:hypothetical protein